MGNSTVDLKSMGWQCKKLWTWVQCYFVAATKLFCHKKVVWFKI